MSKPLSDDDLLKVKRRDLSGLTSDQVQRRCDVKRWRKRTHRPRRISQTERKSLGLPLYVGVDEFGLERARFYRVLEHVIAVESREAARDNRPALMRIGFDGQLRTREITQHPDAYTAHPDRPSAIENTRVVQLTVMRNTASSPLDYLFFQSKAPIEKWEWLAGKRFEYDFHVAHRSGPVTTSLEALLNAKVDKPARLKAGQTRPIVTFHPKRGKRASTSPRASHSDSRLDALARLGRLADEVSPIAFYLLEHVIGREQWLKDVAAELSASAEYVSQRFREALWEATTHYQREPTSRPRRKS